MKTEIKVAIIGAFALIIGALITSIVPDISKIFFSDSSEPAVIKITFL